MQLKDWSSFLVELDFNAYAVLRPNDDHPSLVGHVYGIYIMTKHHLSLELELMELRPKAS